MKPKPTGNGSSAKQRLIKHRIFLQSLLDGSEEYRNYCLQNLSREQTLLLQDLVRNFVHGNISVSDEQLTELERQKKVLTEIAQKRLGKKRLSRALRQTGAGLFSILIPALAGLIGGFLR